MDSSIQQTITTLSQPRIETTPPQGEVSLRHPSNNVRLSPSSLTDSRRMPQSLELLAARIPSCLYLARNSSNRVDIQMVASSSSCRDRQESLEMEAQHLLRMSVVVVRRGSRLTTWMKIKSLKTVIVRMQLLSLMRTLTLDRSNRQSVLIIQRHSCTTVYSNVLKAIVTSSSISQSVIRIKEASQLPTVRMQIRKHSAHDKTQHLKARNLPRHLPQHHSNSNQLGK